MDEQYVDSATMIFPDAAATVGNTPLVELNRLGRGLPGRIVAKLEMRNPCGSVKDRVGVALIDDAERRGILHPGMTLVEPIGGNTGIGLAFVAAIRGYRLILTMPETMSTQRVALLRHLGAEVVLTPGILMGDAVARATRLVAEMTNDIMLNQFSNPRMRRCTDKPRLWKSGRILRVPSTSSYRQLARAERSLGSATCSRSASRAYGSSLSSPPERPSFLGEPREPIRFQESALASFRRC
jgi:hypothetical protein